MHHRHTQFGLKQQPAAHPQQQRKENKKYDCMSGKARQISFVLLSRVATVKCKSSWTYNSWEVSMTSLQMPRRAERNFWFRPDLQDPRWDRQFDLGECHLLGVGVAGDVGAHALGRHVVRHVMIHRCAGDAIRARRDSVGQFHDFLLIERLNIGGRRKRAGPHCDLRNECAPRFKNSGITHESGEKVSTRISDPGFDRLTNELFAAQKRARSGWQIARPQNDASTVGDQRWWKRNFHQGKCNIVKSRQAGRFRWILSRLEEADQYDKGRDQEEHSEWRSHSCVLSCCELVRFEFSSLPKILLLFARAYGKVRSASGFCNARITTSTCRKFSAMGVSCAPTVFYLYRVLVSTR